MTDDTKSDRELLEAICRAFGLERAWLDETLAALG